MLDSEIEQKIVAWAENRRWISRKLQYVGRVGCPDRLFVGYGHVIFMEMKAPGKMPSLSQITEHNRFADAGVTVHVIDDVEDGVAVLRFCMDNPISPKTFD